jgi:hypothetical protein
MRRPFVASLIIGCAVLGAACANAEEFRRLPVKTYRDKMAAGWIGQMCGVGWGAPTEFQFNGRIIPLDKMPVWKPEMVNQFGQDDIYVEMTFLRTLEKYGWDCSIRQAGIDFANSGYQLWHANLEGRNNLRRGIAPPDSGHPKFNHHADDIDYQIEADFAGLIAPGMPNLAVELGEKFGRLMNYGDGLYGGQFVGGMYAAAFFEDDPVKLVEAGLKCIPEGSQYAECIRDVLAWHQKDPENWEKTWQLIEEKYQKNPAYRRFACSKGDFNIDAKINGAYIVMGMLYGNRDLDQTIVISTRCGQDSDCNPSNAAGVTFTTLGQSKLPDRFVSALKRNVKFSHTDYDFDSLLAVCEKLVREAVVRQGGRIEKDANGDEVLVIRIEAPKPGKLEQCWEPGPAANVKFTEEEMQQIKPPVEQKRVAEVKDIQADVEKFAAGWKASKCGVDMAPGLKAEFAGRQNVLLTHPLDEQTPCVLARSIDVPKGKTTTLAMGVAHHPQGDWTLQVKIDGKQVLEKKIGGRSAADPWIDVAIDLSPFAGKTVKLELVNKADGWQYEAGYWHALRIESR